MSNEKSLQDAKVKIGSKQTLKMVEQGLAIEVYVALDADTKLLNKIVSLCRKRNVKLIEISSMLELGKMCGIEVGAAMAAIVEE
ncbi:ribosomal L7Ae/L30e/S12e/Gadd45 family protein [Paenibacillus sp. ACRRX]|uniref:ribosomal L7Ae/L30e/S12e/Gadd45 family protein n=1 Tax=unclassified Paenibacillus TaxID=185978 RepID=UPI001EF641DF|nr:MULTISPECIES: ribosomal L7Ae/L30e/S12e/Gadd45 family protein [unclassified Paenibacillus]MCG7410642.1 ribosomal L7Ae/L30e/S12e/Gadd45 family protein [Paenibacillus sp. ACRRX]MDK8184163.1 ribosomal L7Ae/L30e/S12e/Gadd45 family protein [Paenibacillus sp. UMB4589-SE434]